MKNADDVSGDAMKSLTGEARGWNGSFPGLWRQRHPVRKARVGQQDLQGSGVNPDGCQRPGLLHSSPPQTLPPTLTPLFSPCCCPSLSGSSSTGAANPGPRRHEAGFNSGSQVQQGDDERGEGWNCGGGVSALRHQTVSLQVSECQEEGGNGEDTWRPQEAGAQQ